MTRIQVPISPVPMLVCDRRPNRVVTDTRII